MSILSNLKLFYFHTFAIAVNPLMPTVAICVCSYKASCARSG